MPGCVPTGLASAVSVFGIVTCLSCVFGGCNAVTTTCILLGYVGLPERITAAHVGLTGTTITVTRAGSVLAMVLSILRVGILCTLTISGIVDDC